MATLGAAEYTELVTATMEKLEAGLVDQILLEHPTLELFAANAKSITGRELVMNIEAAEDGDTAFTDASATFNTNQSGDVIGAAVYPWASPLVSKVRVIWQRLQENSGKEQVVDLLKTHVESAKKQHRRVVAEAFHARASVPAELTDGQFLPFDKLFGDSAYDANPTGAAAGSETPFTVGGITATDADHFWNSQRIELPKDDATFGVGKIRKVFRHVRNELQVANGADAKVTHVICGRNIFEEYEDSFDDAVRYVEFDKGQGQFRAIYDGDIQLRLDPDCPPDRAYFVDISTLRLTYLNGNWMKVQPAQQIVGTLDFVTPLASVITTGTNQRRANAVLLRPDTAGGAA